MISNRRGRTAVTTVFVMAVSITMLMSTGGASASAASSGGSHCAVLNVPSQYSTIQQAINAAHSCDTIRVASGTYVEQLTIDKSITIVGAGIGATVIQSPATLSADAYGTFWTIELGNAATVSLSGFTLLETLRCLVPNPAFPPFPYEGGGIGVGGSANLTLQSAVVSTTGLTEGGACGAPGDFLTYGTGIGFGLDYAVGSPSASALIGTGTVYGVTISGFGFAGSGIEIGGSANSPTGSYALVSHDKIYTSADANNDAAAVILGYSGNPETATIVNNFLDGQATTSPANVISVADGSSAYIAHNTILSPSTGIGVLVYVGATATITYNSIQAGGSGGGGVYAFGAGPVVVTHNWIVGSPISDSNGVLLSEVESATVSYNVMGQFSCTYNATLVSAGICGPNFEIDIDLGGILNVANGPGTFVETNNLIYNADIGIYSYGGCAQCSVSGNVILNSYVYGLAGVDGSYTFGPDTIVGGAYGVAAIAYTVDTAVTLLHVVIIGPSSAPLYYENDCLANVGTSCTDTITGT